MASSRSEPAADTKETAMSNETERSPVEERSGPTVDDAVATAEAGSRVEGVHTPSGQAAPGKSRLEQMREVEGAEGPRVDGDPLESGRSGPAVPGPGDIGSGGAQRLQGGRISDRVAAGESAPEGVPFHADPENPADTGSGAGA
jgi:hypothetical protein